MLKHITWLFENWTNATKPKDSCKNELGFNTDEKRLEFYIADMKKWFYLWSEYIVITESSTPPYFIESFETGWQIEESFIKLFEEFFETNWFVNENFSQLFIEDFSGIDW